MSENSSSGRFKALLLSNVYDLRTKIENKI